MTRAREDGGLRADFTLEDLAFVTWSITRTIEATAGTGTTVWRRYLGLISGRVAGDRGPPAAGASVVARRAREQLPRLLNG